MVERRIKQNLLRGAGLIIAAWVAFQVHVGPAYDLVIRNGQVIDGTGSRVIEADIAISNGRFVKVGEVSERGAREIEAHGRYVTPGWIDMMDQSGEVLLTSGLAENKLLMGVTTAIGGEGGTPVPAEEIPDYFRQLETQGISLNFGIYYNAFQAREAVVGDKEVVVNARDLAQMQDLVRAAMEAGVVGMSSATFYPPLSYMKTHELVALAKAMAPYGGIYAAHMRDESRALLSAVQEMITIGEAAGVPVEIFHFKNAYAPEWDRQVHEAITLINDARGRGLDIAADQYPYIAGGTGLDATVPTWVFAEGNDVAVERLADPAVRKRLKREISDPRSDRLVVSSGGWRNIVLAKAFSETYARYEGRNFEQIASELGRDAADAAWDIMLEALPERAYALYFMMSEQDVQTIMRQPWVSIGSDAGAAEVLGRVDALGLPHPRAYGTFPRIISRYVRELGVLSLEDAIRKMTSLPAARMKLSDRGVIREGYWADVVIFDYESIEDKASWEQPFLPPGGIEFVMVNGEIVIEQGKHTGRRPGQVVYGPGYRPDS